MLLLPCTCVLFDGARGQESSIRKRSNHARSVLSRHLAPAITSSPPKARRRLVKALASPRTDWSNVTVPITAQVEEALDKRQIRVPSLLRGTWPIRNQRLFCHPCPGFRRSTEVFSLGVPALSMKLPGVSPSPLRVKTKQLPLEAPGFRSQVISWGSNRPKGIKETQTPSQGLFPQNSELLLDSQCGLCPGPRGLNKEQKPKQTEGE